MKFNGAIFSKPQQDQLKENIGNELEKIIEYKKYTLNLSTSEGRNSLISLSQVAKQGKRVVIVEGSGNIFSVTHVDDNNVNFEHTEIYIDGTNTPTGSAIYHIIVTSGIAKKVYLQLNTNNTINKSKSDVQYVNLFIEK